jgi:hypothetical protein
VVSLAVGAVAGAARRAKVKQAVSENIVGMLRRWVSDGVRPSLG